MESSRFTDDYPVRQRALDPEGSFICEAPAGSGKTELLTQRVLTLLASVDQPESVLAITFTRKAAAEMRERILRSLAMAKHTEPVDQHQQLTWKLANRVQHRDQALGWNILDNPGRLQIRTFDSLTHMLTRSLPLQASLGVDFVVGEDADQLYSLAIKSLMSDLDAETACSGHLHVLLAHLDNRYPVFEALLKNMLAGRDVWLPVLMDPDFRSDAVRHQLEESLQSIVADKIDGIKALIPPACRTELCELIDFATANLRKEKIDSPICALNATELFEEATEYYDIGVSVWTGLREFLLTKDGEFRKKLDRRSGFPSGEGKHEKAVFKQQKQRMITLLARLQGDPGLAASLQECTTWPGISFSDNQWKLLQSLTVLLPHLVAHLQLVFRERGEVDFIEVSARAGQALGDPDMPTDLALRLDYRIQHILVDEFQDTSFAQIDLLERLTAGWEPGDGRTLFCVGDAMQSIYSFRGANVGLFLKSKTLGLGDIYLEPLQLTSNFRSQAALVEWCNQTFSTAFPASNDITRGAVAYSYARAFKPALAGDAVQTRVFPESLPPDSWALHAVEVMQAAWQKQADTSVAVLVRNRSHAATVVKTLKQSGIPYRAVELELLAERSPVQDVLALTCSLLFPSDRIAGLATLRAPWCGLLLADLEVVANRHESQWILHQARCALEDAAGGLRADGAERLQRVLPILERAYLERDRKPLRMWVEGTWVLLGGPAVLGGEADLADVERFFELLETLQQRGPIPSRDYLEDALLKLYAAPDPGANDRLQIMTIHKSKGLEFDLVILPELQRQPRRMDKALLLWQKRLSMSGEEQLVIGPVTAIGEEPDAIYRHLEYEAKIRQELEACRLLYVACTRAKKRLYLYARLKQTPDGKEPLRPPPAGSLLRYIWSIVRPVINEEGAFDAEDYPAAGKSSSTISHFARLPSNWHQDALPVELMLQDYVPRYCFDNAQLKLPVFRYREDIARLYGTLVHEVMQSIGERGLEWWGLQDLNRMKPKWITRLRTLGMPLQDVERVRRKALDVVQRSVAHPRMHWIHNPCFRRHTEYPVSVVLKGEVTQCIIDLLLVDGNDAWIVDYKTSEPATDQNKTEFLESETRTYRPVMRQYKKAVEGLGYKNVRCALFMIATGDWVEY